MVFDEVFNCSTARRHGVSGDPPIRSPAVQSSDGDLAGFRRRCASGKDPGFGPAAILQHAARTSHYSADEVNALAFAGTAPDAGELSRRWHAVLREARETVAALPGERAGLCALTQKGELFTGDAAAAARASAAGELRFHAGRIRGALPRIVPM